MRTITLIVLHCSAVRPDQNSSAAQIDTWHRQRGFHLGIGYHYVVRRNGARNGSRYRAGNLAGDAMYLSELPTMSGQVSLQNNEARLT